LHLGRDSCKMVIDGKSYQLYPRVRGRPLKPRAICPSVIIIAELGNNFKGKLREHPPPFKEDFFMQTTSRVRYTAAEVQRNTFYQMPKFLFEDEFKSLSNDARMLYSLLRDRHELSFKNQWFNEDDEIYLIYSRASMCEKLNLSEKTITKAMNSLKNHKLIEEQRQGMGRPNLIYLLTPQSVDFIKNRNFSPSRQGKFPLQDRENFPPNKTNINKTDESQSQSQSQAKNGKSITTSDMKDNDLTMTYDNNTTPLSPQEQILQSSEPEIKVEAEAEAEKLQLPDIAVQQVTQDTSITQQDEYIAYRELLRRNIEYDRYLRVEDRVFVDELMDCMLDVICTKGKTVRINGEDKSREMVKGQYLKLNNDDIEHVLSRYKNQRHQITHVHNYLKTMLYNVKQEVGHYYANAVRVDGLVK